MKIYLAARRLAVRLGLAKPRETLAQERIDAMLRAEVARQSRIPEMRKGSRTGRLTATEAAGRK